MIDLAIGKNAMQIAIDLPRDLEQDLIRQAEGENISLQTLIIQALRQLRSDNPARVSEWPAIVLSYDGIPDIPTFKSYRAELLIP